MLSSTLLTLVWLISLAAAGYVLQDDYNSNEFFSMFDFFTADDPTHGYVNYVDQSSAQNQGLIGRRDGATYIGVDNTNVAGGRGRNSVRLSSKKTYTRGLIVLDLQHMPGGQCGTWPAFWTFGPDWPNSGEIDIIEGVNSQNANKAALHTSAGCTISNTGAFNGQIMTPNCDVNAPGQYTNAGCQISSYDSATYGQGFNANGGGVYATEWTSDAISIFFFPRGAIPRDLSNGNPNPTGWGKPMARFEGGCNFDQKFQNHNIIFDVTFCGDWAGNVWGQDSVCSSRAPSCQAYVQNNPGAFTDAFWQVNSLKVYSSNGQAVNKAIAVDSDESSAMASPEPVSSAASVGTETSTSVAIQMSTSLLSETSTSLSTETSTSLPTETSISLPSETSTISSLAAQVANTALPTTTPAPTTLATATQRRNRHKTVSPLQWSHFGGSSKGRPAYAKEKRSEHAGHLLQHRHKAHA